MRYLTRDIYENDTPYDDLISDKTQEYISYFKTIVNLLPQSARVFCENQIIYGTLQLYGVDVEQVKVNLKDRSIDIEVANNWQLSSVVYKNVHSYSMLHYSQCSIENRNKSHWLYSEVYLSDCKLLFIHDIITSSMDISICAEEILIK